MEVEIARHDWSSLRSFAGNADRLPDAIRTLVHSDSYDEVDLAYKVVNIVTMASGRLSQSSAAVASCLMHGLFISTGHRRELILDLLAQIAGGYEQHADEGWVGPVSYRDCMIEIVRGFALFSQLLEHERTTTCIDLVLMCGLADDQLRARAVYVLSAALDSEHLPAHRELIAASLSELIEP